MIGCSSLQEAKSALREQIIDVVLADVHLGDGLGHALPDEIDSLDGGALPVVLISSDTSTATREWALRLGAEFYLSKPVRPHALRDTVALALSRAAVRDARLARRFVRHVDDFLTGRPPETMNGYRVASAGGTASAGGGDLVLHLPMGDRDRIVLIDVIGHGVAARAWAVAYAAIVRTLHHCVGEIGAGAFLTELARVAWAEPSLERALATVLVVDLDPDGAWVASAGHPPPPCRRRRDSSDASTVNALLGVLPPEPHEAERIELRPGDRLALFTDGLDPADVAAGGDPPPWFMTAILEGRPEPLARVSPIRFGRRPKPRSARSPPTTGRSSLSRRRSRPEAGRGVGLERPVEAGLDAEALARGAPCRQPPCAARARSRSRAQRSTMLADRLDVADVEQPAVLAVADHVRHRADPGGRYRDARGQRFQGRHRQPLGAGQA